ncbi:uncharacterized protein LOC143860276 [Tasmannia lanceolata]|uniref:uncharacterized protein LOC143860276 n=1 Tax=Tasmannia lanceolata TaxID=3420 RepID=UPI0040633421
MVCGSQRKVAMHRRLHVLQSLASSKSVRRSSVYMDALYYVQELKLKVERLNKEYMNLQNQIIEVPTEVKVERMEKGVVVQVTCKKGRELLVSILEVFEEVGLEVLQAKVSCNHNNSFFMEAIVQEQKREGLDVSVVKEAVLKALESKVEKY